MENDNNIMKHASGYFTNLFATKSPVQNKQSQAIPAPKSLTKDEIYNSIKGKDFLSMLSNPSFNITPKQLNYALTTSIEFKNSNLGIYTFLLI
jgi:hypothetical protein